jgi:hypothetical protein
MRKLLFLAVCFLLGDKVLEPTCQRFLHILGPRKFTMSLSLFRATCKQFHDTAIFSSLLFKACMSIVSTYLGSLQKIESNVIVFIDMKDVTIFRSVYF